MAPAYSLYFGGYEAAKRLLSSYSSMPAAASHFAAGTCAELFANLACEQSHFSTPSPHPLPSCDPRHASYCAVHQLVCSDADIPYDVTKQRLQTAGLAGSGVDSSAERGVRGVLGQLVAKEGVWGVYRGVGATLLTYAPFSGTYFLVYEARKKERERDGSQRGGGGGVLLVCWGYWMLGRTCACGRG